MSVFSWKTIKEIAGTICGASLGAVLGGLTLSRDAGRAVWGFCAAVFGALAVTGGGLPKELPAPPEHQARPKQDRKGGALKRPKGAEQRQRRNAAKKRPVKPVDEAFIAPPQLRRLPKFISVGSELEFQDQDDFDLDDLDDFLLDENYFD